MAASSLGYVDAAVVAVGLPAIGRAFSLEGNELQWVLNAFLLPVTAFSLLGGAWGDRFGRRRALILGASAFGVASAASALAPTFRVLIGMRLLQGIGAALLVPNSLAILGQMFKGRAEVMAVGFWSASVAVACAIAPIFAGVLIDSGHWRGIFLLNAPLAVLALGLTFAYVPKDVEKATRPLDLPGGALVGLTLGAFVWSLTAATTGARSRTDGIAAAMVATLALLAFLRVERQSGDRAMLPLSLLGSGTLGAITVFTLLLYGALNTVFVLIPFVLLRAAGYTAAAVGTIFVPLQIIFIVMSPLMGGVTARMGPKIPLGAGALISGLGFLMAMRIQIHSDYARQVFPAVLTLAIGMSAAAAPLTTLVLISVDEYHTATASGINSTATRLGSLVSTALLGAVFARQGAALFNAFSSVMLVGATLCVAAASSVLLMATLPESERSGSP